MFTGIISEVGTIEAIDIRDDLTAIAIRAPSTASGLAVGDSIAVNGVCLTAVGVEADGFTVEAIPETMSRSNLGRLTDFDEVNLERPMPANGRFDGHIVQGHVDGVGTVASRTPDGESVRVRYEVPPELARYIVEKGSIAVDGTSLTVSAASDAACETPWFEVALIPHTLASTILDRSVPGDEVNLEVDVVAKYVERMIGGRP